MKTFLEKYGKTLLFFAIIAMVGGFLVGMFMIDTYPESMKQQMIAQISQDGIPPIPINILLGLISAIQSTIYALILGSIGIVLGKKTGLWKDETNITAKPLIISIAISVIGGLCLIIPDVFFFGKHSEVIANSYAIKPSITFIIASITYGAVIEEVMCRLFFMSLVAFILHRIFGKGLEKPQTKLLIIANVIASLLFAAGHLPATLMTLGDSPIILFRCFALNGGLGLLFGYLYRKYGLRYSMISHGGCHLVSKTIWLLFL